MPLPALLSLYLFVDVDVRSIVDSIKILDNGNGDEDKGLEVSVAEGRIRILFLPDGTSDNASTLTGSTVIAAATVTAIMVVSRGRMIAIYLFYEYC